MSITSVLSRFRLPSTCRMTWCRDSPSPFGPSSMRKRTLEAISTSLGRLPPSASPMIVSDSPRE